VGWAFVSESKAPFVGNVSVFRDGLAKFRAGFRDETSDISVVFARDSDAGLTGNAKSSFSGANEMESKALLDGAGISPLAGVLVIEKSLLTLEEVFSESLVKNSLFALAMVFEIESYVYGSAVRVLLETGDISKPIKSFWGAVSFVDVGIFFLIKYMA
jgi:p-aminobenzoyl-glutamate transporter AbgT